jgi:hypothetical protein
MFHFQPLLQIGFSVPLEPFHLRLEARSDQLADFRWVPPSAFQATRRDIFGHRITWEKVGLFRLSKDGRETSKSHFCQLVPGESIRERVLEFERVIERIWYFPTQCFAFQYGYRIHAEVYLNSR